MIQPIISPQIRLRHPELFQIDEGSIVDDFCYFSTQVSIGRHSHIASSCTVAGGPSQIFRLGDFSSVSAGVRIWCTSDNFAEDIVTIIPAGIQQVKERLIVGDVTFERLTAVGANSVVMPDVYVPEGTVIGAMSFVPAHAHLEPWTVYAGVPIRAIKGRNRAAVMRQLQDFERQLESLRSSGEK